MQFKGLVSLYNNRFYIFHIDNYFIPTELPYWNVVLSQYEIYCKQLSLAFCNLTEGDTVIDIGAGLGEEVVVYANKVGNKGKVICLEPHPEVFTVLLKVVELNDFKNTTVYNFALYHSNTTISLTDDSESYDATFFDESNNTKDFLVKAMRFDTFMKDLSSPVIKLLKVNIEGAERFLLNNDYLPLFRRIQHMAIACHDFRYNKEGNAFFKTKQMVMDFFIKQGFSVKTQNTGQDFVDDWVYVDNPQGKS
ncbi:MAG: FkbM family methyltransferase [Chitinophagaceae bacterium]